MKIIASEVVTPPTTEPLTLAEVKRHLNVLHATEDAMISGFALAARRHVEETCSIALINQTQRVYLSAWPRDGKIPLYRPPLVSVTVVKYLDADEVEQTLAADQYHVIKNRIDPHILRRKSATWPTLADHPQAVWVDYVCGYGTEPSVVPQDIRNAVLMLAEHLYFNRGETSESNLVRNPVAADALLGPYKTHGWL
jgi:uncharacterized phiE125 gp8 family phage protein